MSRRQRKQSGRQANETSQEHAAASSHTVHIQARGRAEDVEPRTPSNEELFESLTEPIQEDSTASPFVNPLTTDQASRGTAQGLLHELIQFLRHEIANAQRPRSHEPTELGGNRVDTREAPRQESPRKTDAMLRILAQQHRENQEQFTP